MKIETRNRILFFILGISILYLFIYVVNFYSFILFSIVGSVMVVLVALEVRELHSHYFKKSRQDYRVFINKNNLKKLGITKRFVRIIRSSFYFAAELKDISETGIRVILKREFNFAEGEIFDSYFETLMGTVCFKIRFLRKRIFNEKKKYSVLIFTFLENEIENVERNFNIKKISHEISFYTNFINFLTPIWLSSLAIFQNLFKIAEIYTLYSVIVISLFILAKETLRREQDDFSRILPSIYINLLILIYPSLFAYYALRIFSFSPNLVMLYFLMTFLNDGAAFLGGKLLGKKSMHPFAISPKKTLAGLLCGFSSSVLIGAILYFTIFSHDPKIIEIGLVRICILGVVMGIMVPFGDLVASAIKRSTGFKDSSSQNFFGRGGFLDNVDSILFTGFVYYSFIKIYF